MTRFTNLGIIKNKPIYNDVLLNEFEETIRSFRRSGHWSKGQIVELFFRLIPDFDHKEMGKYLDEKM